MFVPVFFSAISVAYLLNGVWEYFVFRAINWDYIVIIVSFAVMAIVTAHKR